MYGRCRTMLTPSMRRPKLIFEATIGRRTRQAVAISIKSYSELGIEPPEPLSILMGRNIVPRSSKKPSESSQEKQQGQEPEGQR